MRQRTNLSALALIMIGIIAGALVFSQFNPSTAPKAYSADSNYEIETTPQSAVGADRPLTSLRDFNKAFIEISKEANPSVVMVFTEKILKVRSFGSPFFNSPFKDFFGGFFNHPNPQRQRPQEKEYRQQGLGSGVIVKKDGYILTNNHVIDNADTIYVQLNDERTIPAKIIGTDPKTDIAVLKIDEENLPAIKMGDSDKLQVGEWVLAIGSPMSANLAHSVTSGIVSAKGRSNVGLADYEDFIQTDAAINPGNSGGALINLDGELVGINTAIATRSGGFQGIGFAVPVNMGRHVMESLIEHGTVIRGWLGVYIQDINENMAKAMDLPGTEGALISDVSEDSPAEDAGLEEGDVIIKMDGEKIEDTTRLRNTIAATKPDTKVKLTILRDGKEKDITIKLGKLEADKIAPETEERLEKLFGFRVKPFSDRLAENYGLDKKLHGVVVTSIKHGSTASRAGLKEGDLIMAVNRQKLENMEEFNELVQNLKKGNTVLFRVVRQDRSFYIAFTL